MGEHIATVRGDSRLTACSRRAMRGLIVSNLGRCNVLCRSPRPRRHRDHGSHIAAQRAADISTHVLANSPSRAWSVDRVHASATLLPGEQPVWTLSHAAMQPRTQMRARSLQRRMQSDLTRCHVGSRAHSVAATRYQGLRRGGKCCGQLRGTPTEMAGGPTQL